MNQRWVILTEKGEPSISIVPKPYDGFHNFKFTVGQPTEAEQFSFRFSFLIIDSITTAPPENLERIGTPKVALENYIFDPQTV